MDEGGLWVSPQTARELVGKVLREWTKQRISVAEVAIAAFGVENPDRSATTQIGKAIQWHGWHRIEQRTRKPRYVYEPGS